MAKEKDYFCAICGSRMNFENPSPGQRLMYYTPLSIRVCGKPCHTEAERRYTLRILQKDDIDPVAPTATKPLPWPADEREAGIHSGCAIGLLQEEEATHPQLLSPLDIVARSRQSTKTLLTDAEIDSLSGRDLDVAVAMALGWTEITLEEDTGRASGREPGGYQWAAIGTYSTGTNLTGTIFTDRLKMFCLARGWSYAVHGNFRLVKDRHPCITVLISNAMQFMLGSATCEGTVSVESLAFSRAFLKAHSVTCKLSNEGDRVASEGE